MPAKAVAVTVPVAIPTLNAVKAAKPQPPQAAPRAEAPSVPSASVLFDGISARPAASSDDPVVPDDVPSALTPNAPRRFSSRLSRWSGVSAVWSVYRDGILLQRHAARLLDPALAPAARVASARLLASYGRLEAVPSLGLAAEQDSSPEVRRAALDALLILVRGSQPELLKVLALSSRPGARQLAASTLSWTVRYDEALPVVRALASAAELDSSEDVRLAAIHSLSVAVSPEAALSLSALRSRESRPHMRSGLALHAYRPPQDELADATAPLQEVALKRSIVVSSLFVAVELIGGFVTGNVALKADSFHMAADQLIKGAALLAIWLGRRPPNSRKSYGYLKVESVVGLLGSLAIAFMGYEMGMEAWHRFLGAGGEAATWSVALYALASLGSNLSSALILRRHQGESLSMKGAFLHSMTDAVGSLSVIVSAAAAILLGWTWVEPVAVALILVLIAKTSWDLGKPSWDVLIDAVPKGTDLDVLEAGLLEIPGAAAVKDLHVWALNSKQTALTVTVLIRPGAEHEAVLAAAKTLLKEKHGISHATVQIETLPGARP